MEGVQYISLQDLEPFVNVEYWMDFLDIILNLRNLSLLQLHNNVSPWPTYTKDVMMVIYIFWSHIERIVSGYGDGKQSS